MNNAFSSILKISAPLLFASLGALCTEYAGVLAVFIEGAVTLSGFFCIVFTIYTGSKILGFLFASSLTVFIIILAAVFTIKTKANPFLTGLSINIFAEGVCSSFSAYFFHGASIIAFSDFSKTANIAPNNTLSYFYAAVFFAFLFFLFLKFTVPGFNLKYSGKAPEVLVIRGVNINKYKIFSWAAAGWFSSCAGAIIVFRLSAYTANFSAGKGWTALAVVFLGLKNPIACIAAVLIFSAAEYTANILQAASYISPSLMLSLPYLISLLCFILGKPFRNNFFASFRKNYIKDK